MRLTYFRRTLALVWAASGGLTAAWLAVLMVQGLVPVATVWLTKPLVDGVTAAVGAGATWEGVRPILGIAGLMIGLVVLAEFLRLAVQWISQLQSELVQDHVSDLIHAKATAVDMAFYETPADLDRLYRVRFDASSRPLALLEGTGALIQNAITVVGIGALLLQYGVWLVLPLLIGTIPAFIVVLRASRQYHDWWVGTTTDRRRTQYFGDLLTGAPSAAEVRLFGLGQHFRTAYRALRLVLRTERLRLLRRQSLIRLGAEFVAMLSAAGTVGWMIWRALAGLASLGDIALFYQAFQRGQGLIKALFGNVNQLYSNSLFLENLYDFLDLKPTVVAPASPQPLPARLVSGVRFSDVSFRYPGTDRLALEHFDLEVPAGRTVAIVGANGAGKSTLIKLLARFYDPESGRVEVDGIDLRQARPGELHRLMTIMFQTPMMYQGTARENIAMSDLGAEAGSPRVEEASRDAGAHEFIASLAARYETLLGKSFPGGTELSGGEWQRVAMARAYFRRTPIVVLDEPTSQMDSWAEAEWFERFRHLTGNATALIITHRLAIARRADKIHVMEHGRIVESGTHEELLAAGGRYATSWESQGRPALTAADQRAINAGA
jgi:ATP-binding cassette subfamily B protein